MNKEYQRGFGMVDMAIAVAVAGILVGIFATIQQAASQRNAVSDATNLYSRIDEAIVAFAQLNDRLPCPSTDDGGVENCSGATTGQVPYLTIGLPNYEAASVTYSLNAYTASDGTRVDLSKVSAPGVLQFQMSNQPTSSVGPLQGAGPNGGNFALLGLCEAMVSHVRPVSVALWHIVYLVFRFPTGSALSRVIRYRWMISRHAWRVVRLCPTQLAATLIL